MAVGRRLLVVLPPPGTRGTAQRTLSGPGNRGGRRDVRALGAHLGPHRRGRHGRHVPGRRLDVRRRRRGHDPRRPRGGRRFGHVLPALLSCSATASTAGDWSRRRRGRPPPYPGIPAAAGTPSSPGCCAGPRFRPRSPQLAGSTGDSGARHAHRESRRHRHPREPADHADLCPDPAGVPGRRRAGQDRRAGTRRHRRARHCGARTV